MLAGEPCERAIIRLLERLNSRQSAQLGCPALPFECTLTIVDSLLKQFSQSSQLGANAAYIEDLYEQYLVAPDSVGPQWRTYFDGFKGREAGDVPHSVIAEAVARAGRAAARRGRR